MSSERIRLYELMLVISPEADDDGATAVQRIVELIASHKGNVSEQEQWGLRRLAYQIKGFREGQYALIRFSLGSGQAREIERALVAAEDVIRHLLTIDERPLTLQRESESSEPEPEPA